MLTRENMMIVAMIVTLAATIYLYRESQKQRLDITNVKYYVSRKLSSVEKPKSSERVPESAESEQSAGSDED
jgi:hypothetical protein